MEDLGFYSTAAQVIPVLWIVMVVEARMRPDRILPTRKQPIALLRPLALLYIAVLGISWMGEIISLNVLRVGHEEGRSQLVVFIALSRRSSGSPWRRSWWRLARPPRSCSPRPGRERNPGRLSPSRGMGRSRGRETGVPARVYGHAPSDMPATVRRTLTEA